MTKRIALGIVLLASAAQVCSATGGLNTDGRLDQVVRDYKVAEDNLARALIVVASRYDLPMGIEWIEPTSDQKVRLSWNGATLRQVLESIAKSQPGYDIRFSNDFVHVYYQGAESDRSNFLNLKLRMFKVQQKHIAVALYNFRRSVMAQVSPENKCCAIREIMLEPNNHLITEEFQNSTVRSVLDNLTLQSDSKVWVVTFPLSAGLTPTRFRRTCSLWNDAHISDNDQPIWDRFRWGMPLPARPTHVPAVTPAKQQPKY